jgi:hypothetical protein
MSTPLHNCFQTELEIKYFKEKLTEIFLENKKLKNQLVFLEGKNVETQRIDASCQTSNVSIESLADKANILKPFTKIPIYTSNPRCLKCISKSSVSVQTKAVNTFDNDFFNQQNKKSYVKLCEMHHNLLKKLENEVNDNTVKQDLINHMKLELDQLEAKCVKYENNIESLYAKIEKLKETDLQNKKLSIELESFKIKCQKYKNELKCFDEKFFEEIEDLKFKYCEAVKLNKHYEKILMDSQKDANKSMVKNRVKFAIDNDSDILKSESEKVPEKTNEFNQFDSLDLDDLININNNLDSKVTNKEDEPEITNFDLDLDLCLNETLDINTLLDQR